MKHIHINYKVHEKKIDAAKTAIREFIEQVRKNESGTLSYSSFQSKENFSLFTHIITFENEKAEEIHRNSIYIKKFVDTLYPICESQPVFTEVNLIASK